MTFDRSALAAKAERLRALHQGARPLVLVNAWDAGSAKLVASLGFPAIGTSSAGIANANGFADGQKIPFEMMAQAVEAIARAIDLPVSADLEAGYGTTLESARETARAAIACGAAGLNFEDGAIGGGTTLIELELQAGRIAALRAEAKRLGVPLVINARTDAFLLGIGTAEEQMAESVHRAKRYLASGADSIFVPGAVARADIAHLAREIAGPLNVLAKASTPSVDELTALGVRRISLGSAPMAYAMAALRDAALEVRDRGTFDFDTRRIAYAELNAIVEN